MIKEKRCTKCKEEKSLDGFHKNKATKDGLQYICKICDKNKMKKYKSTHKKETKEYYGKYYQNKKEETKEYFRKYRKAHKKQIKENNKKYYKKNRDQILNRSSKLHLIYQESLVFVLRKRWIAANYRCNNAQSTNYEKYGAKGIKNLFTFQEYFDHITLDLGYDSVESLRGMDVHRIDNDGNYEIGNIQLLSDANHKEVHVQMRRTDRDEIIVL